MHAKIISVLQALQTCNAWLLNTPLKENHNVSASAIFDKLHNSLCDNFFTDGTEIDKL